MALTHVSMWTQHGWKRVTIEEVVKSHSGGTVSARSGLFKCDLCGQYVTLADGPKRSYFKHNSNEIEKDCLDRSLYLSKNNSFKPEIHDLPLRIVVKRNKFSFELGFTPLPQQIFEKNREKQILIKAKGIFEENFQYDWSRLNNDTTNYLYVGEKPAETYGICIANSKDNDYQSYWPKEIEGIPNKGILFDSENALKLVQYKDVCVNHTYYFLKRGPHSGMPQNILRKEICAVTISGSPTWFLYEITVQKATKEAAIFLYDLNRYNLTDEPAILQPIWPVFQVDPYLIRHESDSITFYLNGDAEPKIFPSEILLTSNCETGKVISVKNSNKQQLRQQLLAIGKTKTMDYQYIRYGMRKYQFDAPEVFISDESGEQFAAGKNKKLPPKQLLRVSSSVDGFIERFHKENLTEVLPLYADKALSITKLRYGDSIFIYLGLDMVWQVQFERIEEDSQINDNQLLNQLKKCKGESIHIDHSIGTLAIKMKNFPLSKRWLSKAIVSGKINKDAYLLLITLFGNKEK